MKKVMAVLPICALVALVGSGTAYASDAVVASVTVPADQPQPIIVENGTTESQGTYAIGTIHLLYTVEAMEFPVGDFAVFNLGLAIQTSTKKPYTEYPVNGLELDQTGSSNLVLSPATSWFSVGSSAWSTVTPVTIRIPADVSNEDGTELVGNLQIESPGGASHLDTVTTVKVKIKLVHPTACLKLYDVVTDTELATVYTAVQVNVNKQKQVVTSTNPGQLSNNVLVVNTCGAPETFDAKVLLDPSFATNPSNNPGNAVFTFTSSSEVNPANLGGVSWSAPAPQGQNLCLANVTVPAHSSWLATVKVSIMSISSVGFPSTGSFNFSATLLDASSPGCTGAVNAAVTPANPATAQVTYTVK